MLASQIKSDMTAAMKAAEPLRLSVLRMLTSELNYKQIDAKRELTDEEVVGVIQKEVKKRREAIESCQKAGRSETAAKEEQELDILQAYLPAQMSEEEVRQEVVKLFSELKPTEFGQAMGGISPVFKGRADGALVARIVKECLA